MIQIKKEEKLPKNAMTRPKPGRMIATSTHRHVTSERVMTRRYLYRGIPASSVSMAAWDETVSEVIPRTVSMARFSWSLVGDSFGVNQCDGARELSDRGSGDGV
jgi:hypothetical protein